MFGLFLAKEQINSWNNIVIEVMMTPHVSIKVPLGFKPEFFRTKYGHRKSFLGLSQKNDPLYLL